MEQLTFTDGFTALLLLQSLIVGTLLILDVTVQNRFLGLFVIIYASNSSRIVLYKLVGQTPFLDFYVGLSLAGFFSPLLYFFMKSHIASVQMKSILYHSIVPILLSVFSFLYSSGSTLQSVCSNEVYNLISYTTLFCLSVFYGGLMISIIRTNSLWKEILKSVRFKIAWFVFGITVYVLFISLRIIISIVFDISSNPDDPFYLFQKLFFYIVFAIIPFYAYTVLIRFKKFIQPKNVTYGVGLPGDLKPRLDALIDKEKIHTNVGLNANALANVLNVPQKDLRVFFKNTYSKTIPEFLTDKRLAEFISMAENDTNNIYNIEGIAKNAGFNSRPTFYRAFKKRYGVTPAEYLANR
ncbi:helix-turn-helix domain-containing protein [Ekhidna sp.]|uniref:helix-turn-helix domain-containing protein n=1 Tax=Ekhidna sp. TaxID=2608089 RepID=UPI003CCC2D19